MSYALPNRLWLSGVGIVCLALLALGSLFAPAEVARGWLIGFVFWSSTPIGATALLLIHALTGGRWGSAATPALALLAPSSMLLPLAFLALVIASRFAYPWFADPSVVAADVARFYLNVTAFAVRGIVGLVGWAVLAWLAAGGRITKLGAGLGLVFHGVAVTVVATDWVLAIAPHYSNSAIGMELATQQLLLALAFVGLVQPGRAIAQARGDIGGLMLACALGAAYLGLMTFIVKWYGDQPIDSAWYFTRAEGFPWIGLMVALLFGALIPIVGLAWRGVRESAHGLWWMSASVMLGVAARDLWWFDASALESLAAALAGIGMAALSLALVPRRLASEQPVTAVGGQRHA